MAIDWFVAPLLCPTCHSMSPEDDSTEMSTRIQMPTTRYIHVGERVDGPAAAIGLTYVMLRSVAAGETIRILVTWSCPSCASDNWARVEIAEGIVASIQAVPLSRDEVAGAHFISDEIRQAVPSLVRLDFWSGDFYSGGKAHPDLRDLLLKELAPGSST